MTITKEIKDKLERVENLLLRGSPTDYVGYRELVARRTDLLDLREYLQNQTEDDLDDDLNTGEKVDKT